MSVRQLAKYVSVGLFGATVSTIAVLYSQDSVPLTFKDGDVISAGVINSLLGRLNDVQKGFTSESELVGTWSCTTFDNNGADGCPYGAFIADGDVFRVTQLITFSTSNGVVSYTAPNAAPGGCGHDRFGGVGTRTGTIRILGNKYALMFVNYNGARGRVGGWNEIVKLSPTSFQWQSGPPYAFTSCSKISTPPAPPSNLTSGVSGSTVVLTWIDQSADETGFKVQRKSAVDGDWSTVATVGANTATHTHTAATGVYWYRVIATNGYGDSISSSEIRVVVG